MTFKNTYTTEALKVLKPEAEKDKVVVSDDAYLNAEMTEHLANQIRFAISNARHQ